MSTFFSFVRCGISSGAPSRTSSPNGGAHGGSASSSSSSSVVSGSAFSPKTNGGVSCYTSFQGTVYIDLQEYRACRSSTVNENEQEGWNTRMVDFMTTHDQMPPLISSTTPSPTTQSADLSRITNRSSDTLTGSRVVPNSPIPTVTITTCESTTDPNQTISSSNLVLSSSSASSLVPIIPKRNSSGWWEGKKPGIGSKSNLAGGDVGEIGSASNSVIWRVLKPGIRRGVPDRLKAVVWLCANDAVGFLRDHQQFYQNAMYNTFGDTIPSKLQGRSPTFCGGILGLQEDVMGVSMDVGEWEIDFDSGQIPQRLSTPAGIPYLPDSTLDLFHNVFPSNSNFTADQGDDLSPRFTSSTGNLLGLETPRQRMLAKKKLAVTNDTYDDSWWSGQQSKAESEIFPRTKESTDDANDRSRRSTASYYSETSNTQRCWRKKKLSAAEQGQATLKVTTRRGRCGSWSPACLFMMRKSADAHKEDVATTPIRPLRFLSENSSPSGSVHQTPRIKSSQHQPGRTAGARTVESDGAAETSKEANKAGGCGGSAAVKQPLGFISLFGSSGGGAKNKLSKGGVNLVPQEKNGTAKKYWRRRRSSESGRTTAIKDGDDGGSTGTSRFDEDKTYSPGSAPEHTLERTESEDVHEPVPQKGGNPYRSPVWVNGQEELLPDYRSYTMKHHHNGQLQPSVAGGKGGDSLFRISVAATPRRPAMNEGSYSDFGGCDDIDFMRGKYESDSMLVRTERDGKACKLRAEKRNKTRMTKKEAGKEPQHKLKAGHPVDNALAKSQSLLAAPRSPQLCFSQYAQASPPARCPLSPPFSSTTADEVESEKGETSVASVMLSRASETGKPIRRATIGGISTTLRSCDQLRRADIYQLEDVTDFHALLNARGREAVKRLLWVINNMYGHDVEFCPVIPHLCSILLLYMSEHEAFSVLHCLIRTAVNRIKTEDPRPFMAYRRRDFVRFVKVIMNGVDHRLTKLHVHMRYLKVDMAAWVARSVQDGFARTLPLDYVLRIYGAFLFEGLKTFYRYCLAILKLIEAPLLNCTNRSAAENILYDLSEGRINLNALTKMAYRFRIRSRYQAFNRVTPDCPSPYLMSVRIHHFYRPRLSEPSTLFSDNQWEVLWSWLPSSSRILDPVLGYRSTRDGLSISAMMRKLDTHHPRPMIYVLKTGASEILGGFSPFKFSYETSEGTDMKSDAFVFTLLPSEEAHWWTGANQSFISCKRTHIYVGSCDIALYIDGEMRTGRSRPSSSFNSPQLVHGDSMGFFEIASMEVWLLK